MTSRGMWFSRPSIIRDTGKLHPATPLGTSLLHRTYELRQFLNTHVRGQASTMGDSDDTQPKPASQQQDATDSIDLREVARQFLQDETVKGTPREQKVEYLKEKGLSEDDITALLDEVDAQTEETQTPPSQEPSQPSPSPENNIPPPSTSAHDPPPVITYPEFLTKPARPPPLVTGTALLNTLYACAGLTTLLYGTSKYAIAPMVESLTAARADLHATTSDKLSALSRLLESTVSEIPPTTSTTHEYKDSASDSASDEDPTELFHRDIGVQTSLPSSPGDPSSAEASSSSPAASAAAKLASLTSSVRALADASVSQSDELADVKAVVDLLKDDIGTLTFPGPGDFVGGFSLYGAGTRRNEPEDEIKKARDNIRRVKGVMLSTRNFPLGAR